jgi:hypothetical protein
MMRIASLMFLLTFASLSPLSAQGDKPAPTPAPAAEIKPDKEVAEKLDQLKDIVDDKKFARDGEGFDVITVLVQKWQGGLGDKDKKSVVKGIENVMLKGKLRPSDKAQLYTAAAVALGQLGVDAADAIKSVYEDKRFPKKEEWVPLRCELLKALGKTKDETKVKFLIEIARRDPEAQLEAAAGEALGNYEDSKQEIKKEIVSGLLIRYGEIDSRSRQIDPADIEAQNMQKRLAVISGKWNDAMRRLTGQTFHEFPEWNEWHNKNKNKEWK